MLSRDGMCRRITPRVTGIGKYRKTEDPECSNRFRVRPASPLTATSLSQAVEPFKIGVQFEQVVDASVARIAKVEHQHDRPLTEVLANSRADSDGPAE